MNQVQQHLSCRRDDPRPARCPESEDRFAGTRWEVGEYGAPILPSSLGIFECKRHTLHEAGDHFLLVGQVEKASFEPRRDPLLYFRGKYRRLHFT